MFKHSNTQTPKHPNTQTPKEGDEMSWIAPEEEVISSTKEDLKEPSMYKVLLHNDDYTTMEFVVDILMFVFNKSPETAMQIMLSVHEKGIGVCGVYTYEVAETKVETVHNLAKEHGFPLRCSMEEE
jgi:ATP-dependent Clp protease adaptor protein ClpS